MGPDKALIGLVMLLWGFESFQRASRGLSRF